MNLNIQGEFQIYISVPLRAPFFIEHLFYRTALDDWFCTSCSRRFSQPHLTKYVSYASSRNTLSHLSNFYGWRITSKYKNQQMQTSMTIDSHKLTWTLLLQFFTKGDTVTKHGKCLITKCDSYYKMQKLYY